jgi:hypothetical protein
VAPLEPGDGFATPGFPVIAAAVVAILVLARVVVWRRPLRGRGQLLAAAPIAVALVVVATIGQVDAIDVVNGASYMGPLVTIPTVPGCSNS